MTSRTRITAGYVAALFSLEYVVGKTIMAARGELGMPGHPAPPEAAERFTGDIATAQLGNAALGLVALVLALAFAQRWGRRVPRPVLAAGAVVALLSGVAGALVVAASLTGLREDHGQWGLDSLALTVLPLGAWAVLAADGVRGVRVPRLRASPVGRRRRCARRTAASSCSGRSAASGCCVRRRCRRARGRTCWTVSRGQWPRTGRRSRWRSSGSRWRWRWPARLAFRAWWSSTFPPCSAR